MKHLIILSIVLINTISFSQDNKNFKLVTNKQEIIQKLNDNSVKINSITSDFVQEKHLAFLDDVIITKGKFWFMKENKLRWEYISPYQYLVVINNGKFYIKDDQNSSEYDIQSNKAFVEVNDLIISSVRGNLLKEDKFIIDIFKNSSAYLVKLVPKNEKTKSFLNQIELYFDSSSLDISKVKLIENKDDYTIITFNNRKLNEKIPVGIFTVN